MHRLPRMRANFRNRTLAAASLHLVAALQPGIEPTLEGEDALEPALLEHQRRPGAGGLYGSTAVEDDLALGLDLREAPVDLL